jgi:hypothetical protein
MMLSQCLGIGSDSGPQVEGLKQRHRKRKVLLCAYFSFQSVVGQKLTKFTDHYAIYTAL